MRCFRCGPAGCVGAASVKGLNIGLVGRAWSHVVVDILCVSLGRTNDEQRVLELNQVDVTLLGWMRELLVKGAPETSGSVNYPDIPTTKAF